MSRTVSPEQLISQIGTDRCPIVVDVRREDVFRASETRIAGAVWRDHMKTAEWLPAMPKGAAIVVYCVHGHNVSELAAAELAAAGADVRVLEGGFGAYEKAGGVTARRDAPGVKPGASEPSVWVTRARPKIDRIACPWLIRRFVDPFAAFRFVAPEWVADVAEEMGGAPFDIADVAYSHRGETCTFDTMIDVFGLAHPPLLHLARIVRGADTARLDVEPEAAGLLAVSLGLSAIMDDDLVQLERGMLIYDALYGWCRQATGERHSWQAA